MLNQVDCTITNFPLNLRHFASSITEQVVNDSIGTCLNWITITFTDIFTFFAWARNKISVVPFILFSQNILLRMLTSTKIHVHAFNDNSLQIIPLLLLYVAHLMIQFNRHTVQSYWLYTTPARLDRQSRKHREFARKPWWLHEASMDTKQLMNSSFYAMAYTESDARLHLLHAVMWNEEEHHLSIYGQFYIRCE